MTDAPLRPAARIALAASWLAILAIAGWFIAQHLHLSGDLRRFMPAPRTAEQKLLIDELGEGPGSRLLLAALSGADEETLASQSRALRAALADDKRFTFVANGEGGLESFPDRLRPYRYLLSRTLDTERLDTDYLADQVQSRVADLGSPAAAMIEPLVPSDPTLETLALAESWAPGTAPHRVHGVWFDRGGGQALLAIQTRAPGFDPAGQADAVGAINAAYAEARGDAPGRLSMTGPGAFSVEISGRTEREARWIGFIDTIGLLLLLFVAYRNWKIPVLGALPLASAGLAGLGAVALLFRDVHGITIAFGFTLIGVVQDYPIHFFSHQRTGVQPYASVRALWPALATGVASTCIAYATFFVSGVDGLEQLAVFTIVGLATAALSTRFLLPALVDPDLRDPATSQWLERLRAWVARLPQPRAAVFGLALAAAAVAALAPGPFWQNDLSRLTPVPPDALAQDAQLRQELGAPDVRYVIALTGRDVEDALQRSERLAAGLEGARAKGWLAGFEHPAQFLPSQRTQRERQARLPEPEALRKSLDVAVKASPFRDSAVFAPFLADVEAARHARVLQPKDLEGTPLQVRLDALLLRRDGHATALVSLIGLAAPDQVAAIAERAGGQLVDLKAASESLVAAYRQRVLWALGLAALLLIAAVRIALRSWPRTWRVLAPMAVTTLVILAVLRALGVELTLFHLVALILAAGLGLDYALFFEHAGDDRHEQVRTLHAVLVCSAMTLLVFALLGLSSIPVLRAIGATVTLGVVGNFVLGLLIARHPHKEVA
ncbi:MMPL family transporter [Lysobacter sp. A6]|uniref:MMPL family transporter n=1 Tax=Noviluteimonas lactosilytica TaxID=2888523 RepID=A0ABS8JHD8_9GAMM|nr:MMPL family transporter [Lysobacter lactosilyticus]MCC8362989.1 MMPL family transporter [Lysobacter lactosilyticus]